MTPVGRTARAGHTTTAPPPAIEIPRDRRDVTLALPGGRSIGLTNLDKIFFREAGVTKGDLLQYYADVAGLLVPYLAGRAMVLKRYPNGSDEPFFYMKRTPPGAPPWLRTCAIEHASGSVIDFPVVDDVAGLLWAVNLGCIDLNEWYARCDDVDRPDYLHFDLDPVEGASFATVRRAARSVGDALTALGMSPLAKTSGSSGIHVYVAIERGPLQKEVWTFAKALAQTLAQREPDLLTAEYRIARRPPGRVLVDYNQNAWGKALASVYCVRPRPRATVSTPVTWAEIDADIEIEDFRLDNVRARFARVGDLWAPMRSSVGRFDLRPFLTAVRVPARRVRRSAPA